MGMRCSLRRMPPAIEPHVLHPDFRQVTVISVIITCPPWIKGTGRFHMAFLVAGGVMLKDTFRNPARLRLWKTERLQSLRKLPDVDYIIGGCRLASGLTNGRR